MRVTYPALFYYDDSVETKYFIHFPDFKNSATMGTDISDAMYMGSDWLGTMIAGYLEDGLGIPKPSDINHLSLDGDDPFKDDNDFELKYDKEKSFISMVTVDVSTYLDDQKLIERTLTIPRWADRLGKEMRLNFSETLTDAIAAKKFIE